MDVRGLAQVTEKEIYFMGGMQANQEVSDQLLRLTLGPPVGIDYDLEIKELHIYPNPSNTSVTLQNVEAYTTVRVYSMQGMLVDEFIATNESVRLNIETYTKGMYVVRAEGDAIIQQAIFNKQ